jgi:hypothetical protein
VFEKAHGATSMKSRLTSDARRPVWEGLLVKVTHLNRDRVT